MNELIRANETRLSSAHSLIVFDILYESLISTNYRDGPAIACDRQTWLVQIEPQRIPARPFHGDLSGHVSRWFLPLLTAKSLCCEGERGKIAENELEKRSLATLDLMADESGYRAAGVHINRTDLPLVRLPLWLGQRDLLAHSNSPDAIIRPCS